MSCAGVRSPTVRVSCGPRLATTILRAIGNLPPNAEANALLFRRSRRSSTPVQFFPISFNALASRITVCDSDVNPPLPETRKCSWLDLDPSLDTTPDCPQHSSLAEGGQDELVCVRRGSNRSQKVTSMKSKYSLIIFSISLLLCYINIALCQSWISQDSGTSSSLYSVDFIDNNEGWISGGNGSQGLILHTTNGGTTWESQT